MESVVTQALYHIALSQLYERGDGKGQSGNVHLYLEKPFKHGRLDRPRGGVVCGKRAWEAREPHSEKLSERCPKCVRMALLHSIPWPKAWQGDEGIPVCPRGLKTRFVSGSKCDCHQSDGLCNKEPVPAT